VCDQHHAPAAFTSGKDPVPIVQEIAQNNIEVDAKTKESTRKTKEKLDGKNKESHARKKPK
jgi:hypothetical protein